ncbi:MAG: molybdate ABC transporter substrate-binding protein [Saprospiraceae bacterium]
MCSKWSLFFTVAILCSGCYSKQTNTDTITIATAANMQFAMEALSEQFTAETGIVCQLVVSSSGKLTAQIIEGAPFDLFVAANMKYPEAVYERGLAQEPPRIYAYGKLVLWTMRPDLSPDIPILNTPTIKQIAVANPKTAPYGQAASETLQSLQLDSSLQAKLVFGESIAQTNSFILTQVADLGFTAMSVVLSPRMKNQGHWIAIDEQYYQPITQGLVLLKGNNDNAERSRQFYNFLFSTEAKEILQDFGYTPANR